MALVSTTTVLQPITSGPPLNNQEFQGWYYNSASSWEAIDCPTGQSLLTTSNYAQCCSFGATTCSTLWTSCDGSTAVGVTRNDCDNCASMSIYEQYPAAGQDPFIQIICGDKWLATTVYREFVTTSTELSVVTLPSPSPTSTSVTSTTSASSTAESSSSPSTTTTAVASTASAQTTGTTTSAAASPISTQPPAPSDNKAWIAGVVVGPLIAIALTALVLWFFCIRKKRRPSDHAATPIHEFPQYRDATGTHSPTIMEPPKYRYPQTYEMSTERRTHELAAG